jgi:hypothetical protein
LGDTGFGNATNAQRESPISVESTARALQSDPELVAVVRGWPNLTVDFQQQILQEVAKHHL